MMEIRASNAHRWMACPGSAALEPQFPDRSSPVAEEGTAAHHLAAMVLNGVVGCPEDMVDRQVPNGVIVDPDMAAGVQVYLDALKAVAPFETWTVEDPIRMYCNPEREVTPDAWALLADNELHIFDLKYGWSIVEPRMNWQLLVYVASILWGHTGELPSKVHLTICQPRPPHPRGRTRTWSFPTNELSWYMGGIAEGVKAAQDPDAKVKTGSHCRYCRALGNCPAGRTAALAAMEISLEGMAESYSPAELAAELDILDMAEQAVRNRKQAVESQAVERMKSGESIPGYSVEDAFGREQWCDGLDLKALGLLYGVELIEEKPITPAQARKAGVPTDSLSRKVKSGMKLTKCDVTQRAKEIFS